jgi:mannose-1-phosphate guanylyltransferase/phosphomannomutase
LPLDRLIRLHRDKQSAATLVLRADALADRYGSVDIDDEDRIHRFLETRSPYKASGALRKMMFTGVQILEPKIFAYMEPEAEKFSTTKHIYPKMLARGEPLFGYCFEGYWQDLGTVERIKEAEKSLASGQTRLHYL